jgi:hypothetical protein
VIRFVWYANIIFFCQICCCGFPFLNICVCFNFIIVFLVVIFFSFYFGDFQERVIVDTRAYQKVTLSKTLLFTANNGGVYGLLDDRWKAWCEHYGWDADMAMHVTERLFKMPQVCAHF